MAKKSAANALTQEILLFLFRKGVYARRHGVASGAATYTNKEGATRTRYIHAGITGGSDIFVWLPNGKFWGIEIKIGKDRLHPEQIGFMSSVQKMGHLASVVKDFPDFLSQWNELSPSLAN